MAFVATLVYELSADTTREAGKLLLAELIGRRYLDHWEGKRLPANTLWARRTAKPEETVLDLQAQCEKELLAAASAVRRAGLPIVVKRAWCQVTGAGTFGLLGLVDQES